MKKQYEVIILVNAAYDSWFTYNSKPAIIDCLKDSQSGGWHARSVHATKKEMDAFIDGFSKGRDQANWTTITDKKPLNQLHMAAKLKGFKL